MAPSSDITVYHARMTRSSRVVFLLEELGLPYKVVKKPFLPFGLRDDAEYVDSIHPLGLLPGFTDGPDITIIESVAVMQYLVEQYDPEHKLSPPISDKHARAAYLNWLVFAEATLAAAVGYTEMHTLVLPEERRNARAAEQTKIGVTQGLAILEKALAGKTFGIVNGSFTAADIVLYQTVYLADELLHMVSPEEYPNISAWYAEVAKRPAAAKAYKE
ncbi:hypothetical protein KFL_000750180 [Klebsormidium nitens]|uniref:Glutathione S-transferase n=1 Tax=Klebsormidium nitens TaxID=105231 RepID=A0A0U9HKS9_KLENI|nr:hypothetical protein KFL_000750180 [Klebsormidium nitens]|eukprot:GAQ81250.1 hypothetical protein KFL_000750180 [Klebsormidium nitens]